MAWLTWELRLNGRLDQLDGRVVGLEDRLIQRTELLRADIAAVKAEAAVEQAYGKDTSEALRRHVQDPHGHGLRGLTLSPLLFGHPS